jgi:hypothetical protein
VVVVEELLVDVLVLVELLELVVVVVGTAVVLVVVELVELLLVVVVVGFGTIVISQRSSIQGSGVLHLLIHPTVRRITLLDIIATEYLCA